MPPLRKAPPVYSTSLRSILLYTCLNNVKGTFTEFLNLGCQKKNWCNITLREFQEIMNFLSRTKKVLPFPIFVNFFYIFEAEIYQAFRDNPQTTCLSSYTDHFSSDTVCFSSDTASSPSDTVGFLSQLTECHLKCQHCHLISQLCHLKNQQTTCLSSDTAHFSSDTAGLPSDTFGFSSDTNHLTSDTIVFSSDTTDQVTHLALYV